MLFSSISFLYYFLPCVLLLYFAAPKRLKNSVLLLASLFFYGWGEPKYLVFMLVSIAQGYVFGLLIEKYRGMKRSKLFLTASVLFSLGLLGYCKYADFLIENFNAATGLSVPLLEIALPIGISFYTFQILSYAVDVYRGSVGAQKNFIRLALYIAMFPQLIAGPIVRYADIETQLGARSHTLAGAAVGVRRFILGLSKKVLLANLLGELVAAFKASGEKSVLYVWLYAVAYALQVYFDFSGYSDMAIGLGRIFGFRFAEKLRPSLRFGQRDGVLAQVAYFARHLVPRLPVHPARREPRQPPALAFEPADRLDGDRAVARRGMELRRLGPLVCGAAHTGKAVAAAASGAV